MGGGGGSNPAAGMTAAFGGDISRTGQDLSDWSGRLKLEDARAMKFLNPFIKDMVNTAFDPQQQLYNRTLQQVTDQTRSGEAARGLANTPYGSALEGSALNNFNIDWQNQQLGRQEGGLGSAVGAYSGLIGAGATAAQPEEAALQGFSNAFNTSSQASTEQAQMQQQANQFAQQQLGGLGQSIGGLATMGKG